MEVINQTLARYLPPALRGVLQDTISLEEIRLRTGSPVLLRTIYGNEFWEKNGRHYLATEGDIHMAVQLITESSLYALEEEMRRGYITLPGGHRVGLAGKAVLSGGTISTQRDITALNYRIAREVEGAGKTLLPLLFTDGHIGHTLIVSPPGAGKTTLLRELTALLADGYQQYPPHNVSIVDERSEIAGTCLGQRQLYVGQRTDVLDGAPKGEGMMLMIRSMAPDILVTDEIGGENERTALAEAINCGVTLLLTAHGRTREDLMARPVLRSLLEEHIFERTIILSRRRGPGTVEGVYDAQGELLC